MIARPAYFCNFYLSFFCTAFNLFQPFFGLLQLFPVFVIFYFLAFFPAHLSYLLFLFFLGFLIIKYKNYHLISDNYNTKFINF